MVINDVKYIKYVDKVEFARDFNRNRIIIIIIVYKCVYKKE
jgi:hypothetical protein